MQTNAPSLFSLLCYSAPAFILAFAGMPLYIHAPDFYATEFSLSLSALGGMLLVLRVMDAVLDLGIGHAMDRLTHLRRPIMFGSLALLGIGIFILFNPIPSLPSVSFFIGVLLATLAFSAISINLNSLGAQWLQDARSITRLTTTREALGLLGLITAVMLPSLLMRHMDKAAAFSLTSMVLLIGIGIAATAFGRWYRSSYSLRSATRSTSTSLWRTLRQLSAPKRRFFLIYGLSMLASSIPAVLVLFFIRDRLGAEAQTGIFLLLYFLAGALALPVWQRLSMHIGIRRAWGSSMLLACASFIWAYFLGANDLVEYGIICVVSGVALGAELAMPPALLTQHMQQEETAAHSATYFALMAFLLKASMAAAAALALPLLEMGGFVAGAANSDHSLHQLSIAYALLPCALKMAAFLLLQSSRGFHEKTFSS